MPASGHDSLRLEEEHHTKKRGDRVNTTNHNGNDLPETTPGAAAGTGAASQKNSQLSDGGDEQPCRLVTRATALRGQHIARRRVAQKTIRKNTESDLKEQGAEVSYYKAEKAIRDLVCSILERQDRMNEEIFYRVIDLQCRMDDLEDDLRQVQKERGRMGAKE